MSFNEIVAYTQSESGATVNLHHTPFSDQPLAPFDPFQQRFLRKQAVICSGAFVFAHTENTHSMIPYKYQAD